MLGIKQNDCTKQEWWIESAEAERIVEKNPDQKLFTWQIARFKLSRNNIKIVFCAASKKNFYLHLNTNSTIFRRFVCFAFVSIRLLTAHIRKLSTEKIYTVCFASNCVCVSYHHHQLVYFGIFGQKLFLSAIPAAVSHSSHNSIVMQLSRSRQRDPLFFRHLFLHSIFSQFFLFLILYHFLSFILFILSFHIHHILLILIYLFFWLYFSVTWSFSSVHFFFVCRLSFGFSAK